MFQNTVTIGCPIRNRSAYIPYYLENIYSLTYDKKLISLHFLVNNSTDNSEQLLLNFKSQHEHEYRKIIIEHFQKKHYKPEDERTNDARLSSIYKHLVNLRNTLLSRVGDSDFLFSVDSDIMLQPNTLNKLLSAQKDAVAGLIYNGYLEYPESYWKYPNILNLNQVGEFEHISNWYIKNASNLKESKLIPVDGTGAIILLSNKICKETQYSYNQQGEDMGWSLDCKRKGYQLYCDISAFAHHLMSEQMLDKYIKNKILITV